MPIFLKLTSNKYIELWFMQNEHFHSVLPSEKIMENKPTCVIMRHLIIKSLEGLSVKGVTMGLKRNHQKVKDHIIFSSSCLDGWSAYSSCRQIPWIRKLGREPTWWRRCMLAGLSCLKSLGKVHWTRLSVRFCGTGLRGLLKPSVYWGQSLPATPTA